MHRRLIEANMRQTDEPLADVLGLLTTLAEGWEGVQTPQAKPAVDSAPVSQPSTESAWSQPATVSSWSPEPATANAWSKPETENPWPQPVAATPWAQPAAETPWSLPATENAWTQPAPGNTWSQIAAENPLPSEPPADNPWAQPDSPWAQPVPQEGDYRLRAFSF
jgi:hypothetical protein